MSDKIFQTLIPSEYDVSAEVTNLADFLKKNNLSIADDFFTQIAKGDIIEVYSFQENIQLYINSEFKRVCSYSEQQMKEVPFAELFWRDQQVFMELVKRAMQVCQLEKKTYQWNVENHELVESLHPRKRTFEMKMKNIAPCFNLNGENAPVFASTLQVEFIFEWGNDIT